jgi:HAD superfamily hydrolase (TIGR01549 family)
LFDLDGTLYAQAPLRALMAMELTSLVARSGPTALRVLREYRRQAEELRAEADLRKSGSFARSQIARTASAVGWDEARVERLVDEWMQRRPLKYLRACRRAGVVPLLDLLRERGMASGVLSDYPVTEKLNALGLAGRFSPALCTTDPEIDALKPHPRGFERACALWSLAPEDVLYVGDRPGVDAAGAANAGMECWIVSCAPSRSLGRLRRLLRDHA